MFSKTAAAETATKKTLVIILAQTRAHEITYQHFKKNVLDQLNADLCICIGRTSTYDINNPFYQNSKYRFYYDEPEDYTDAFNYASDCIKNENPDKEIFDWKNYLDVKDQFLGGIRHPTKEHPGSAGILIFFRWYLLKVLKENNINYDRYIITRSDYLYVLPHPSMNILNDNYIWIPNGEHYGGVTDRHVVLSKNTLEPYLNILYKFITEPENYYEKMKSYNNWNLEQVIKFHLEQSGVFDSVKFFPFVMYSVRGVNDNSRWGLGKYSEKLGYYIKYKGEFESSCKNKILYNKIRPKNLDVFYLRLIGTGAA